MARYTGPVCRLCRRERMKLYLKGTKCDTMKCPIERRPYPPGDHGRSRRQTGSEYLTQLREKQKARRIYGLMEKQFRNLFEKATHQSGVTGTNLLIGLETRLDNIIFRLGFASSRAQARQLVRHRHIEVNGGVVDVPSYHVRTGDEIALRAADRDLFPVQEALEARTRASVPEWLALDEKNRVGRVVRAPERQDISLAVQEQLIVELYSK
jgi:small subunit ribosomal protein S4